MNLNRLKLGNSKLPNYVAVFDLPAGPPKEGGTCLNCATCWETCYARKAQRMYPQTRRWRDTNRDLMEQALPELFHLIFEQIQYDPKIQIVRIHSSGDFMSNQYIDYWAWLVKTMKELRPEVQFYTYTKVLHKFRAAFNRLADAGCNIVDSCNGDPDSKNFGNEQWCYAFMRNHITFTCPATFKNAETKCMENCRHCLTSDRVIFLEH